MYMVGIRRDDNSKRASTLHSVTSEPRIRDPWIAVLRFFYCQTFENRSSLPPNPVAGLDPLGAAGVVVLLIQPPNSSSAATFGAGAKPPEALGTIGWLAKEPPVVEVVVVLLPHPKSLEGGIEVTGAGLGGSGAAGLGGSGAEAHSLEPHTPASDQALDVAIEASGFGVVEVAAAGAGVVAAGLERLNAELKSDEGFGAAAEGGAAVVVVAVVEKSNRSPRAEEAGAGLEAGAGEGVDEKPNGLLMDCLEWW